MMRLSRPECTRRQALQLGLGAAAYGVGFHGGAEAQALRRVGVLFDAPDPFWPIIAETLRGMERGLGAAPERFQIRAGVTKQEILNWFSQGIDGWILLRPRAEQIFEEYSRSEPSSVGLTYFSPAESPGLSAVSMEMNLDAVLPIINLVLPDHHRIHVVYRRRRDEWLLKEMGAAAQKHGFDLRAFATSNLTEATDKYLAILKRENPRTDCLWVMGGGGFVNKRTVDELVRVALRYRFPTFSTNRGLVDRGMLMGAEASFEDVGFQLARSLITQTRTGTPVVSTTQALKPVLNVRVARLLGLNVSSALRRKIDVLVADD